MHMYVIIFVVLSASHVTPEMRSKLLAFKMG